MHMGKVTFHKEKCTWAWVQMLAFGSQLAHSERPRIIGQTVAAPAVGLKEFEGQSGDALKEL